MHGEVCCDAEAFLRRFVLGGTFGEDSGDHDDTG
jgi:hypothetical protein